MRALLAALLLLAACGPPPDPAVARVADVDTAGRGLNRALGLTTAFVTAGSFDPRAPAEHIAASLAVRLESEAAGCGTPIIDGSAVDITFGAACRLASAAFEVVGSARAEVSRGTEIVITLTLDVTVDGGQRLTGTMILYTTNASGFTYNGDVTLEGRHLRAPSLRSGISASSASLVFTDGTLEAPSGTFVLDAEGVRQRFAACYPGEGRYLIRLDERQSVLSFDGNAPQTGVGVLDGRPVALPDRAGCPPR